MPRFNVRPEKQAALAKRMRELGVSENDLEETFVRSSGPGGQHLNKTSTCVMLRHKPTNLSVKMQQSRSQDLNRFLARRLLMEKLAAELCQEPIQNEEARKKTKQKARRARRRRKKESGGLEA